MKYFIFTLLLSAFAMTANAQTLTESANGKSYTYSTENAGSMIYAQFSDQSASTGYTWSVSISNPDILANKGSVVSMPETAEDEVGVPGERRYSLELTGNSGSTVVTFTLTSPGGEAAKTLKYYINVE